MNTVKNKLLGGCLVLSCLAVIGSPKPPLGIDTLVTVKQNPLRASQFFIVPKNPLTNFSAIDLATQQGKTFAQELIASCQELSKKYGEADFQLVINQKKGRLTFTVTVRSWSLSPLPGNCPFCDRAQLKGAIIDETETALAFEKGNPARTPADFLIIPKKHIVNYKDATGAVDAFIAQLSLAQKCAKRLGDPESVTLLVNNGAHAWQTVFHSHMHFLVDSP